MSDLRRVVLDERARAYAHEHLALGNSLCAGLCEVTAARGGEIFTFVPEGTSDDQAHRLMDGGILPVNVERARSRTGPLALVATLDVVRAGRIFDFLQSHENAVCLVDDAQMRCSDVDPSTLGADIQCFCIGEEVYYLLTPDCSPQVIEQVVAFGDWIWHGVAVLCLPPRRPTCADLGAADALLDCVRHAHEIIFGAYDREGFVVWSVRS